jgi:ribokinase
MIVVFGSLNLDLVLTTPDHPRPGETVLCGSSALSPGGKGNNQAVAAARAGAEVAMIGRVGQDAFGSLLIESLIANRVEASGVMRTSDAMTGCAVVAVDRHGENVIYVAAGANGLARADDLPDEVLARAAIVVCQMEVPPSETWQVLKRAKQSGARTILNLAPARDVDEEGLAAIEDWVDVLVVNREEAAQLCGHSRPDLARSEPSRVVRHLSQRLRTTCVLTLGSDGACASDGTNLWTVSSLDVEVKDTTGAGDTFTGILATMLAESKPIDEALAYASIAASLACRGCGAQESMPRRPDIELHVRQIRSGAA